MSASISAKSTSNPANPPACSADTDTFESRCYRCQCVTSWVHISNVAGQQVYACKECGAQHLFMVPA